MSVRTKSKREAARQKGRRALREKRKRQKMITTATIGGLGLLVVAGLAYFGWVLFRPASGQAVPVMADTSHVPEGTPLDSYNSNPPTSGPHYPNSLPAGFYHEADAAALPDYPVGFLVHSLEHGYVIFWYNCNLLSEEGCVELKGQIQGVMDQFGGVKVIAFPWEAIDVPLAMTSWGRLQLFETFDEGQARAFVERNRFRAPEPQGP
jgi:hypothetical protein